MPAVPCVHLDTTHLKGGAVCGRAVGPEFYQEQRAIGTLTASGASSPGALDEYAGECGVTDFPRMVKEA